MFASKAVGLSRRLTTGFKVNFVKLTIFSLHTTIVFSLGPVYEFVCVSFTTGNLNCFRVK